MSLEEAQKAALKEHNRLRALHEDTEPLELASDLCEEAQVWIRVWYHEKIVVTAHFKKYILAYAEHLVEDNQGLIYAEDLDNGENLYFHTDWLETATVVNQSVDATKDWYNGVQYYDFDKPGFSEFPANVPFSLPHFTQVRSKFFLGNFGFKSEFENIITR